MCNSRKNRWQRFDVWPLILLILSFNPSLYLCQIWKVTIKGFLKFHNNRMDEKMDNLKIERPQTQYHQHGGSFIVNKCRINVKPHVNRTFTAAKIWCSYGLCHHIYRPLQLTPKTCKWRGGLTLTEKCPLRSADWDWRVWVQFRLQYNNNPSSKTQSSPKKEKTQKLNLLCDITCACCSVTPNRKDSVWKCGCQAAGKTVRKPAKVISAQVRKKSGRTVDPKRIL